MATTVSQVSPCPACSCTVPGCTCPPTTSPISPAISSPTGGVGDAEFLFNGGAPGNINFDLERSLQGKGRMLVFLTVSAPAGSTSVSLSSTTSLKAGDQLFFSPNGFGSLAHPAGQDFQVNEVAVVAATFVPGSLTVPLVSPLVNPHTGAATSPPADPVAYDVFVANGPGLTEILPDGIEAAAQLIFDPISTLEMQVAAGSLDGMSSQNAPLGMTGLVNGAPTTSEVDRARSNSAANALTMQTLPMIGVQMTSLPAGWAQTNAANGVAATTTRPAAGAGVRHVVTGITVAAAAAATPIPPVLVQLLDGATPIWQGTLSALAQTSASISAQGLALVGSPGTAMTLAFAGGTVGAEMTVSMSGYDIK